jgi:hypothetical protein
MVHTWLTIYRPGHMLVSLGIPVHWRPIHRKLVASTRTLSPRASRKNRGVRCALTAASRRSEDLNEIVLRLEDTDREGVRAYPMGLCGE